jgi:cell division protein FtsL
VIANPLHHITAAAPRRTPDRTPSPSVSAPRLSVVPRHRRAAGFAVALSVLLAAMMLGSAVLHTSLAERQFEIDRLERSVTAAQERFDVLRQERAELRSPTRLSAEATRIGMHPAATSQFVPVDGLTVALAIAATGEVLDDPDAIESFQPLDQFRLVKAVSGEAP